MAAVLRANVPATQSAPKLSVLFMPTPFVQPPVRRPIRKISDNRSECRLQSCKRSASNVPTECEKLRPRASASDYELLLLILDECPATICQRPSRRTKTSVKRLWP